MAWRPQEGELLMLEGDWGLYKGNRVFKFRSAMPNIPVDSRSQLRYVCERTTGIGPKLEEAIWTARGQDWREVKPDEVPGLNAKKLAAFRETIDMLTREGEKSQIISWLISKGASINMAAAAWEEWKMAAVSIVTENCYRLADLPHYSFNMVDGVISEAFGIAVDDPRRIKACIIYCINLYTAGGNTIMSWPDLCEMCIKRTGGLFKKLISDQVTEMFKDGSLRGFPKSCKIALSEDYKNELAIWEFIK